MLKGCVTALLVLAPNKLVVVASHFTWQGIHVLTKDPLFYHYEVEEEHHVTCRKSLRKSMGKDVTLLSY